MELASAGMMRSFMSVPCDLYFTIEAKISRFLDCALTLYHVPQKQREEIITLCCTWTCAPWPLASSRAP